MSTYGALERPFDDDAPAPTEREISAAVRDARADMTLDELMEDLLDCGPVLDAAIRTENADFIGRIVLEVREARAIRLANCLLYGHSDYRPSPTQAASIAMLGGSVA